MKVDLADVDVYYRHGDDILAKFPFSTTVMPESSDVIRLNGKVWTIEFMELDLDHGKIDVRVKESSKTA